MERIVKSEKFEKHSIEGENKDETQEIKTGFVDRRGELGNLLNKQKKIVVSEFKKELHSNSNDVLVPGSEDDFLKGYFRIIKLY